MVTVLFGDLVGFTTLAEIRDPEQVKNLVDRCFERLVVDIDAYGGRVDKIIGDAIVALFGAPLAHEDDAERAVRAALQMQRTLRQWAASEGAAELEMRIGINTGEVLVGALRAGGDVTAMGDVVNTASRLQTYAEPGQVLVGPATHAATRGVVRYTSAGPVTVRGREGPIDAWFAEEALLPPGARPNRGAAPLVGRETELGLLGHAIDTAVTRGRAQLVLLVAEAGMGKTRLAEAAAEQAGSRHDALVLEGRCVPYGEANVWWPVAEALRTGCGISATDPPEVARERCLETVRANLAEGSIDAEAERLTNGLLHLMGYDGPLKDIDTTRAREEVVRSLFTFVELATRRRPMVVVLSDLHWADDIVLERIDQLMERVAGQPFVLIATAREALHERWYPRAGRHSTVVLNLDPLDRDSAGALLDALVEGSLPDDLRKLLLDRSGGNPFYLEELVALLGEAGMVARGGAAQAGELPDTLRGLVAARLDGLGPSERLVLGDAAIMGRRGTVEGLRIMAAEAHGVHDIEDAVSGLVAKDVLVVDDGKWGFRSDLVREVAYGMLTKVTRARGHFGIAKWMTHHYSGQAADTDRIAHHYATAASLVSDVAVDGMPAREVVDLALEWLGRALDGAEGGELHVVAIQLCDQALVLAGGQPIDVGLRFRLARARAAIQLRELERACADLDQAMEDAEAAGDPRWVAKVLLDRGDYEQKSGLMEQSVATLQQAIDGFRAVEDRCGVADGLRSLGLTLMFMGRNDEAEAAFGDALELYRAVGDRRGEAWSLQHLAWLSFSEGRADRADQWLQLSAATFSEIGDAGGLGWALGLMAWVRYHQGRYDEAERLGEQILGEARERGDRWAVGMMLVLLGGLRLWTGRAQQAIEPAAEARELFATMNDLQGHTQALGVLARALAVRGQIDEAFEVLDECAVLAPVDESDRTHWFIQMFVGLAAAQIGAPDRAPPMPDTPNDLFGEAGEVGFSDLHVAFGLLHLQLGNVPAAERFVVRAAEGTESFAPAAVAALALVRAASGGAAEAVTLAEQVVAARKATYADRTLATTARALALAQLGRSDDVA